MRFFISFSFMQKTTLLSMISINAILFSIAVWFTPCGASLDPIFILLLYSPFFLEIFITIFLIARVKHQYWHIVNFLICFLLAIISSSVLYENTINKNVPPDAQDGLVCLAPLVLYNFSIVILWIIAGWLFYWRILLQKYQNRK